MGTLGDHRGSFIWVLGSVWGPYGDHSGRGSFICGLGSVWGPFRVIGGRLYEVWEVYGDPMEVIGGRLC